MDETTFDQAARDELRHLEDAFAGVDPDDVDVSVSDGVLRLDLRDGTKIVINSHRAARQIWMAAVASAWHFDPADAGAWREDRRRAARDAGAPRARACRRHDRAIVARWPPATKRRRS
jgi:CyaY protein